MRRVDVSVVVALIIEFKLVLALIIEFKLVLRRRSFVFDVNKLDTLHQIVITSKVEEIRDAEQEIIEMKLVLDEARYLQLLNRKHRTPIEWLQVLRKGCIGYLAHIVDMEKNEVRLEDVHIVKDFVDMFPEELPGIPSEHEVQFLIELISGTAPNSMAPYRMAPIELKELKIQLQELLDKGFIRPSCSPYCLLRKKIEF
ncbi:hypothetical protein LIER_28161 [Lithospermum erythrorhizon]|uniref:Uncharacterized protein n=1 Tax=Lithospermum erythrorhizon TaxID=34254 RepID=A0AAV3REN8_LITER